MFRFAGAARRRVVAGAAALALAACATTHRAPIVVPLASGARYVAMGSSFAAGPGVTALADEPRNRCGRSSDNYAHQLARTRHLALVDVSCSGATTAHLLGPWAELPPQLDAVTSETRLVTMTIGGNDVGYIGGLIAASCEAAGAASGPCPHSTPPTEQAWRDLERSLRRIVGEVRRRAPMARVVFVDYPAVVPDSGTCAATPLTPEQVAASRAIARRLTAVTARVARATGADMLNVAALSTGHDACSRDPWTNGFPRQGDPRGMVPYHPNLNGMTAVAHALDGLLSA
ncbi:MAG TPA: SGNH/GDSL hydrolase family protein [Gemmatirosa sp.]